MEQSVAKEVFEMRTPEEIKMALEHCRTGVRCAGCPYSGDGIANCWDNFTHDLIVYIQQLEAQQPRWISVGERLPEDGQKIIAAFYDNGGRVVDQARYNNGEFDFASWAYVCGDNVTHWMPMPLPPEEE